MKKTDSKKAEKKIAKKMNACDIKKSCNGPGIYCMGTIGAAVYYVTTATSFWMGAWGLVKALVWPAILVYKAFMVL